MKSVYKIKITIVAILLISILYAIININFKKNSNYQIDDTEFIGKVTKIEKEEKYLKIEIKNQEKLIGTYFYNNNQKISIELNDTIKVTGKLTIPSKNTIRNTFNYRNYLNNNKCYYLIEIKKIDIIEKNKNLLYKIKNHIIKKIESYQSSNYLNVFILGDKSDINNDVIESYQENGISHLFAVSGMHISFISGILLLFLKKINVNEKTSYIITILLLLFYAFLVSFSPSVNRTIVFFILLFLKKIIKLEINNIFLLLLDLSFLLILNPFYLYDIGFQYSFIITFYLILFSNKIYSKKYIISIFKVSLLSFIVSMPITINNFFQINIFSIFYNLFFIPFISLIIFPLSFIIMIFSFLEPIYIFSINTLEQISLYLNEFTIGKMIFAKPNLYLIIIYYILITISIYQKKCIPILLIILILHYNINNIINNNFVEFIDVGQGDSVLLNINNKNVLIDTGGSYNSNIIKNKTLPFLKPLGIKKIDYLLLTHGDFDHMGEAINLVENFKVENVIFNCGEFNDLEKDLIKVLDKEKIPYYSCIKELNIDNNKIYFLNNKDYGNENDNSNVIYTEINGYKFMFMGDASSTTEKEIMNKYNLSNIDVLKVGHHGSKTSSSVEFINKISPNYSVISVGKKNRYGHPNKEVLENLKDSNIYRTDKDGSIMFKIKNNKLQVETCSP